MRYLSNRDLTDCIEPIIPKKEARVYLPHAFKDDELANFFYSCDNLPDSPRNPPVLSRRATIPVYFRLLYSSGLRTTEARFLRVEDVNLKEGVINVRYSKGHSQHFVVLHDSMVKLLQVYDQAITKLHPQRTYFFPARNDSYHTRNWVQKNFRSLWDKYNSSYATAYELRHHYATTNINSWINEGFGFNDKLLYLSKSMGHSNIESTKYYYSLVPRLSKIMEDNTGSDYNDILPEVYDEKN
ncbi:MAG: tyrosine-type recombinase/integrase [Clostridiales bacterium]|nr:tyrosine-type recombinase/integrase [Clostridiales bacterium]